MAEISLKNYLKELNLLLKNEALDELIGHCRHILSIYPKHVDTYRLLGQALLHRRRFQDAFDVFQRVLSADPTDFIAHIGMSGIYEEHNQVDHALWHMERAFEQDPSHPAIHEEVRRLYGKRGDPPPEKVQLTSGALAHIYISSGMYDQAIAELNQALTKEPGRLDLRASLCEALWLNDDKRQAAQVAVDLLKQLPYCLTANKVLGELWLGYGRIQEAEPFLLRVGDMDPYWVLGKGANGSRIDPNTVSIEKFEWTGATAAAMAGTPDWVADISQIGAEEVPDWAVDLEGESPGKLSVEEALDFDMSDFGPPEDTGSDVAPDWMEGFGIAPAPAEPADEFDFGPEAGDAGALDWMDDDFGVAPAPAEPADEFDLGMEAGDAGALDWMDDDFGVAPAEPDQPALKEETTDWLSEIRADGIDTSALPVPGTGDIDDELGDGSELHYSTGLTGKFDIPEESPAWLNDLVPAGEVDRPDEPSDHAGPGWVPGDDLVSDITDATETDESGMSWMEDATEPPLEDLDMDWSGGSDLAPPEDIVTPPPAAPDIAAAAGDMSDDDWINSFTESGTSTGEGGDADDDIDWLIADDTPGAQPAQSAPGPSWTMKFAGESLGVTGDQPPPEDTASMEWLSGLTEAADLDEDAAAEEAGDAMDWLGGDAMPQTALPEAEAAEADADWFDNLTEAADLDEEIA
ncbi:MAG: tetratricopeptide repeat protein, partial [Anaerolineae bacterium]|nr:tetratricopeptide repeat protein [Anaerolineae bacterium]